MERKYRFLSIILWHRNIPYAEDGREYRCKKEIEYIWEVPKGMGNFGIIAYNKMV